MLLNEEQKAAARSNSALRLRDPDTDVEYVLLKAEVYDRLQSLLSPANGDPAITYPTVDEVMAEDWDNPQMAEYDDYENRKS